MSSRATSVLLRLKQMDKKYKSSMEKTQDKFSDISGLSTDDDKTEKSLDESPKLLKAQLNIKLPETFVESLESFSSNSDDEDVKSVKVLDGGFDLSSGQSVKEVNISTRDNKRGIIEGSSQSAKNEEEKKNKDLGESVEEIISEDLESIETPESEKSGEKTWSLRDEKVGDGDDDEEYSDDSFESGSSENEEEKENEGSLREISEDNYGGERKDEEVGLETENGNKKEEEMKRIGTEENLGEEKNSESKEENSGSGEENLESEEENSGNEEKNSGSEEKNSKEEENFGNEEKTSESEEKNSESEEKNSGSEEKNSKEEENFGNEEKTSESEEKNVKTLENKSDSSSSTKTTSKSSKKKIDSISIDSDSSSSRKTIPKCLKKKIRFEKNLDKPVKKLKDKKDINYSELTLEGKRKNLDEKEKNKEEILVNREKRSSSMIRYLRQIEENRQRLLVWPTNFVCSNISRNAVLKPLETPEFLNIIQPVTPVNKPVDKNEDPNMEILRSRIRNIRQWMNDQYLIYEEQSNLAASIDSNYKPSNLREAKNAIRQFRQRTRLRN